MLRDLRLNRWGADLCFRNLLVQLRGHIAAKLKLALPDVQKGIYVQGVEQRGIVGDFSQACHQREEEAASFKGVRDLVASVPTGQDFMIRPGL